MKSKSLYLKNILNFRKRFAVANSWDDFEDFRYSLTVLFIETTHLNATKAIQ